MLSPSSASSSDALHSSPSSYANTLLPRDSRKTEDTVQQPSVSIMPSNRSAARSVHIFDARDRSSSIGGLRLSNGVTCANFHSMIEIFVLFDGDYTLQDDSGTAIEKNESPLQPGNYYIVSPRAISINNEQTLLRTISLNTGIRVQAFRDAVRARDKRCVITGKKAAYAEYGEWAGFEAAHIFPLAYEQHWTEFNYNRWISITPSQGETINSVQNGLLLRGDIHQLFDIYYFSINPDDNYKIVCFGIDGDQIAGKCLDRQLLSDPQRPVDQLLRWHFRQAVLVNMRGAGEPVFEHDFPPGLDMIGNITEGPKAAERMEFELFNRFATQFDLTTL
ncbi:hypothetical protein B7494_g6967 [Chlorociboria aeruginascens]|nr:hypothetical protein B7494_g6967 [Chlorociboria aeruginascens]